MGRTPCEKTGLNKGPWTPEEDRILISYIQRHGHENWRALPKQAGLLRCGKSCRLRWINYLRPGVKRGNLTKDEEETIIKLHELLGNRWSAIAARLPGRTDNEIKNVWHTHLKKKLVKQSRASSYTKLHSSSTTSGPELGSASTSDYSSNYIFRQMDLPESFLVPNESFRSDIPAISTTTMEPICSFSSNIDDEGLNFWYNILITSDLLIC